MPNRFVTHLEPPLFSSAGPPRAQDRSDASASTSLWAILRRQRTVILSAIFLCVAAAGAYVLFGTPEYEATTSLRVEPVEINLPDPMRKLAPESGISTEIEVLRSRALAVSIIDSLGLQLQLVAPKSVARARLLADVSLRGTSAPGDYRLVRQKGGGFRVDGPTSGELLLPGRVATLGGFDFILLKQAITYPEIHIRILPLDKTIEAFNKQTSITRPSREADIIGISYRGTDRSLVAQVPNLLAATFITSRQEVQQNRSRGTEQFLRTQIDTLAVSLRATEDSLMRFRERYQIADLPTEASVTVTRLAEAQAQRNSVDAERGALAALVSNVTAAADSQARSTSVVGRFAPSPYRRLLAFPTLLRDPVTTELLHSIASVENERADLLIRRTPNDPDVKTLTARIHELEEQIRAIATTYLAGLNNQVQSQDANLRTYQKQLDSIPAREITFARLERTPKVLSDLYTLLQTRLKEAEIAQAAQDPSISVIDRAVIPTEPVQPKPSVDLTAAVALGLFIGIAVALAREYADHTIHSRADVYRTAGVPVLGLIPQVSESRHRYRRATRPDDAVPLGITRGAKSAGGVRGLVTGDQPIRHESAVVRPYNPVAEAYNHFGTSVEIARRDRAMQAIVFTSPLQGDGKTTTCTNCALTLARRGYKVLLVDADLRRGTINRQFSVARSPGLSDVLAGITPLADATRTVYLGDDATVNYITTGTRSANPSGLIDSVATRTLVAEVREQFDFVLFDTPPVNVVTDAAILSAECDGVILVARAGVTDEGALRLAMDRLESVRAAVLGVLLNDIDLKRERTFDNAYQYLQDGYYAPTAD